MPKEKRHTGLKKAMLISVVIMLSCQYDVTVKERVNLATADQLSVDPVQFDLDAIREKGVLTALTLNSSTSYFVYRGQAMGYEYELLKRFANHLGVELEIRIIPRRECHV